MKALLAFGLLLLISYLGSRALFRKRNLSPYFYFLSSGSIYIIFGILLGKEGLNILGDDILRQFNPLINLGLGWIGFLFGFQLEQKFLKQFPKKYISFSFMHSFFSFLIVSLILGIILKISFPSYSSFLTTGLAISLGILASISSTSFIPFISPLISSKGEYYRLARFSTSIDDYWGLWGLVIITSFWHYPFFKRKIFLKGLILLFGMLIFSFLLSIILNLLAKRTRDFKELLAILLGTVFFASGVSSYFNFSPIFVNMLIAFIFTRLTHLHEKIYPVFLSTEKPFYIIFLILIGALWDIILDFKIMMIIIIFILSRIISCSLSLPLLNKILKFPFPLPPHYGLSFLSQGGMAIAISINLKQIYPLPLTDVFLTVALFGILINEIIAPIGLKVSLLELEKPATERKV